MAQITRKIGLSLGADICWPICFEDIMAKLDLNIPVGKNKVKFDVKRVSIEPFDLSQKVDYDVVLDRLTHWYHPSREWIKKAVIMDDLYVFNNPWSIQSMEKQTSYCAMMDLGMPIPETLLVPPKEYEPSPDLQRTLEQYAKHFDLGGLGDKMGYPMFMKPYDGGGWVGVSKIDNADELRDAYEKSGKFVMHLQKGILPYDHFVRCVGLGPQVKIIRYDPSAPLHERYMSDLDFLPQDDKDLLTDITLIINSYFGWDFNSCESLLKDGVWHPIDFANPCPDSQVTSLHIHFPWLIKANIRWALFNATYKRPMRKNLDWQPYREIRDKEMPYRERIRAYAKIANERFETDRFNEFCDKHLSHLDEVAWDYFGKDRARDAINMKVKALFPDHEWDEFTEKFWQLIQNWREQDKP